MNKQMKKNEKDRTEVFLSLAIVFSALMGVGAWAYYSKAYAGFNPEEILMVSIAFLVILLAIPPILAKYRSYKAGLPAEDELSRKVMIKTSALAYQYSIYMWLVIMYFSYSGKFLPEHLIGTGIAGMGLLFGLCYIYTSRKCIE